MQTKQEFIQKIKTKYPTYNSMDDNILYDKIIAKHPVYENQIQKDEAPTQEIPADTGIVGSMKKAITPLKETFTETIPQIGGAIAEGAKGAIKDIAYLKEGVKQEDPSFIGRTAEKIQDVGAGIKEAKTAEVMGEQSPTKSLLQSMGFIAGGVSETIGDAFISGLKTIAPEDVEIQVKEGIQTAMQTKGGQAVTQEIQEALDGYNYLKETNPEKARDYKAFFGALELAADATGIATVGKVGAKETGKQVIKEAGKDVITPPITPIVPKPGQGIVQGSKIEAITQPFIKPIEKAKEAFKGAETRLQAGPQEFKGVVGQKPVISPIKPLPKPKIENGIDIAKSDDLIRRGLKPSAAGKTTLHAYEKTTGDLRKGIEYVSKSKGIADDGMDAFRKTSDRKKEIYKTIENNNELVKIKTSIDDIETNLNKYFETDEGKAFVGANPGIKSRIKKQADNWRDTYGDNIVQSDLQRLKVDYNKKLPASDFAKMLQGSNPGAIADAKIAQTLGNILDDNVMKVLGQTNKALNKEYGAVRTLEKALAKRMGVFSRNTKGGIGGLLDTFNAGDIVMGVLTGDVKQAGGGLIRKVALATVKRGENPNIIIKDLFKLHGTKQPTLGGKIQTITGLEDKAFKGTPKAITKPKPIQSKAKPTPKVTTEPTVKKVEAKVIKEPTKKSPVKTEKAISNKKGFIAPRKIGESIGIKSSNYNKSNLDSLIKKAKDTGKMPLNEDIAKGFMTKPTLLQRKAEIDKIKAIIKKEANIKEFVKTPKIVRKPIIKKDSNILDNLNPTGGLYVEYNPSKIAKMKLAKNITTLDKTAGKSPSDIVTIYRGTVKSQKDIVPGDFITTNYDLAKSYAGEGKVITKKVKYSTVLDDIKEPLGEEYIYRPIK